MNILLLNQFFWPDVASVAQYATDLVRALACRGHQVTVLAGRRAYDDPRMCFARAERWQGIRINRIPHTGFGKAARWRRAADIASFYATCLWRLLGMPRYDVVLAMTSPPLIWFLAALFVRLKGGALHLWVMDLNPDQALAAGWLRPNSPATRLLEGCLRYSLRAAQSIVLLDPFMRARILARGVPEDKVAVLPPWTHDSAVCYDEGGRLAFRRQHGLDGRFVVMYSGNHSPCHPLDTLLEAARRLSHRREIAFCFAGGGSEFGRVRRFATHHALPNMVCLPYQPLDRLSASLSAADLHVVVMGDPFVGIVHPCKIYNVLRLGIPFLYIGPPESHVTNMLPPAALGDWAHLFRHGEAGPVARCIEDCARAGPRRVAEETRLAERFSQSTLVPRFVELLEGALHPKGAKGTELCLTR